MTNAFFHFHQQLLQSLLQATEQQLPYEHRSEDDQQLIHTLQQLANSQTMDDDFISRGQWAMCRIIAAYPALTPSIGRDLLWLFGGECMHYMPDDEIARFQQLDEQRFAAEENATAFDYESARARILGLH